MISFLIKISPTLRFFMRKIIEQKTRNELRKLTDRQLMDIGLSRDDINKWEVPRHTRYRNL